MRQASDTLLSIELRRATGAATLDAAIDHLCTDAWSRSRLKPRMPVDVSRLAYGLGVERIHQGSLPCDAILRPVGETRYEILVNSRVSEERLRFTIAHEIGHMLVHHAIPETRSIAKRSVLMPHGHVQEERLCDEIAARLLMPQDEVRQAMSGGRLEPEAIYRLATRAKVSITAATLRIKEVFGVDFAIVILDGSVVRRVISDFRRSPLRLRSGQAVRLSCPLAEDASPEPGYVWWETRPGFRRELWSIFSWMKSSVLDRRLVLLSRGVGQAGLQ